MRRMSGVFLSVMICIFARYCFCQAQEMTVLEELKQLKARIEQLEKKVNEQESCIKDQHKCIIDQQKKISEYELRFKDLDTQLHRQTGSPIEITKGLEIGAGATMIIQGTGNVNDATAGVQKKQGRTDASYSTDITIGSQFQDGEGKAFLHLGAGSGQGLEDNLTLYSNVNSDADNDNNVRVIELWYQQLFSRERVILTFGKLDPTVYFDKNEVANDETTQFIGRIFRNSPVIEFPINTGGIRLAYVPADWVELNYGLFEADADWEKIADNLFNLGQVCFKTNFFDLLGNYRLLGWHSNVYHTKWLDTAKGKEDSYGFGLSFDQKVTDIITAFLRYGWQNPRVYKTGIPATGALNYSLERSYSAGFQIEGKPWGRKKDILAFGVGQLFPSDDYKKAGASLNPVRKAKAEGHLEAYYRITVNDHLSISPDFQYIWNPFGRDVEADVSSIFIGGLRAQVDF